ncbi:MAG: DciA family protein [Planctomycetota bacterium]
MTARGHGLARLRELRTPPEADRSVRLVVDRLRLDMERRERHLGAVQRAWDTVLPRELRDSTTLLSVSRGVLRVRVRSAPARHTVDRFLRSGGLDRLVSACGTTVRSVRLTG